MDYPYIRAWGKMLGSKAYYIEAQVEKARADKAPADATHRSTAVDQDHSAWVRFGDLNDMAKRRVEGAADTFKIDLPHLKGGS